MLVAGEGWCTTSVVVLITDCRREPLVPKLLLRRGGGWNYFLLGIEGFWPYAHRKYEIAIILVLVVYNC